jgi:SPX domain protein involved in polyphosphate accumulation
MSATQNYQTFFQRHEKKYLLSMQQYLHLQKSLDTYMKEDDYGLHSISSLYYDTEDFRIIQHCNEKPRYKEKLRMRSYGVPTGEQIVYIELKKKYAGVTYKRRIPMKYSDARQYLDSGISPKEDGQIIHEIDWFLAHNEVQPKILLSYDRIALYGKEESEFRVTFDFHVRFREHDLDLSKGNHGELLLDEEMILMEVKTLAAEPFWFVHLLSELAIFPQSFSKYGTLYKTRLVHEAAGSSVNFIASNQTKKPATADLRYIKNRLAVCEGR